jgi:aspartyl-tRNA(Asn)/glutamyl-tRNA(Gln) amidotransferase subunit B
MRGKEDAHDYRYFPEPDLPPLVIARAWVAEIARAMPELPAARHARLVRDFGLRDYDADVLGRVMPGALEYFESAVAAGAPAKAAANWIQGEVRRHLKDAGAEDIGHAPVTPADLAALIALIEGGAISATAGKAVFDEMWMTRRSAADIVAERGLAQIDDEGALAAIVSAVVAAHPDSVTAIRAGRNNVFGFLVGLVMKETAGQANPKVVTALLQRAINGG